MKTYGEEMSALLGDFQDAVRKTVIHETVWTLIMAGCVLVLVVLDDYVLAFVLVGFGIMAELGQVAMRLMSGFAFLTAMLSYREICADRDNKVRNARNARIEQMIRERGNR